MIDQKATNILVEGQRKFFDFYEDFMGVKYPEEDLHFLYQSEKYNVLSINTCLLSDKKGEEGTLLTAQMKLYKAIRKMNKEKNKGKVLNIAIGHHTLGCIESSERESIKAHFDDYFIDRSLGLSDTVMKRADEKLSFSKMTFPHQLMRLILVEQIYRAFRINRGEPYHK